MGKARLTARAKANVKRRPVKAGQTMPRNIGGALNAKLSVSVNKKKNG